jgi:hypothetical protein
MVIALPSTLRSTVDRFRSTRPLSAEQAPGLLRAARILSLLVGVSALVVYALGREERFGRFSDPSGPVRASLDQLGISVQTYASIVALLELGFVAASVTIGLVIFLGNTSRWYGTLIGLTLVTVGTALPESTFHLLEANPVWAPMERLFAAVGWTLFGLFLYLFPDGRFTPRITIPLAVVFILLQATGVLFPGSPLDSYSWEPLPRVVFLFGWLLSGVAAETYHYLRIASPEQRQQTRWVVSGLGTAVGLALLVSVPPAAAPELAPDLFQILPAPTLYLAALAMPLTIGISVRRHRLWDVDIIVNRALVYALLTAILAGATAALMTSLQRLFMAVTGDKSDAVVIITTLILASTFAPLKTFLQAQVDRAMGDRHDGRKRLATMTSDTRAVLDVMYPERLARKALEESMHVFHADAGALTLVEQGSDRVEHAVGDWRRETTLVLPIESEGKRFGSVHLGRRRDGLPYLSRDTERVREALDVIAEAFARREQMRLG